MYTGGLEKKERRLGLYLRNEYRNVRNAKRISDRIGQRFHYFENGLKRPLAKATTDQHIELKVHPRYKENYIRFVQVVRAVSLNERPVELHARMERLRKQILDPARASRAALELEAIGKDGIPALKEGLKSSSPEVRFYSADALAYWGITRAFRNWPPSPSASRRSACSLWPRWPLSTTARRTKRSRD